MKTKLENVSQNSISRMFGFRLFLISNLIRTAVKCNSESYFGNMQFRESTLHPVTALGGGEKKKNLIRMPGKEVFANFPKGSSLKTQAHKENFLIFFILKDLEII